MKPSTEIGLEVAHFELPEDIARLGDLMEAGAGYMHALVNSRRW